MSYPEDSEIIEYEGEHHGAAPLPSVSVCVDGTVVNTPAVPQHGVFRTFVLTADNPYLQVLTRDDLRVAARITIMENTAVLCSSRAQAMSPSNTDVTLARPNGAAVSATLPVPIDTTDELWVVGNTYPTRVSVLITRRAP
jgi:hypothetical protein